MLGVRGETTEEDEIEYDLGFIIGKASKRKDKGKDDQEAGSELVETSSNLPTVMCVVARKAEYLERSRDIPSKNRRHDSVGANWASLATVSRETGEHISK